MSVPEPRKAITRGEAVGVIAIVSLTLTVGFWIRDIKAKSEETIAVHALKLDTLEHALVDVRRDAVERDGRLNSRLDNMDAKLDRLIERSSRTPRDQR